LKKKPGAQGLNLGSSGEIISQGNRKSIQLAALGKAADRDMWSNKGVNIEKEEAGGASSFCAIKLNGSL
jgi:hypothetical protein